MKVIRFIVVALVVLSCVSAAAQGSGEYEEYKLNNGLTVLLMEDRTARDVRGIVAVRAGTADEEEGKTGAATLLKHLMDNGTEKIGALDREKERPLLEEISRLYDSLAMAKGTMRRAELNRRIGEVSAEAAWYGNPMEYGRLMRRIGATDVGSEVTWDASMYWSSFPKESIGKWLELNSERFVSPAFRNFQGTLNVVCEEYNRNLYGESLSYEGKRLYESTPYARPMTGYGEDVERLSPRAVEEYYRRCYVSNNMALILVGDFDAERVKPLVDEAFGKIEARTVAERRVYPAPDFAGSPVVKEGTWGYPKFSWYFKGVKRGDEDWIPLDFTMSLLANRHKMGLIDSIVEDARIRSVSVSGMSRRGVEDAAVRLTVIPEIRPDETVGLYLKEYRRWVFNEIEKLKSEQTIPDALFYAAKRMYLNDYEMEVAEGIEERARGLAEGFISGTERRSDGLAQVRGLTKGDVVRCAEKYLSGECMTIISDNALPVKGLRGVRTWPVERVEWAEGESVYAKELQTESVPLPEATYGKSDSVKVLMLRNGAIMHYERNKRDDNFSLTLRYDYGRRDDPRLEYATEILSSAGIMPDWDEEERRRMFLAMGSTVRFRVDDNHFYIELTGEERYLDRTLALTAAMIHTPKFDRDMEREVIGKKYRERYSERYNQVIVSDAMEEYVRHGRMSKYMERLPKERLLITNGIQGGGSFQTEKVMVYMTDYQDMGAIIRKAVSSTVEAYYYGGSPVWIAALSLEAIPKLVTADIPARSMTKRLRGYDTTNVMVLPEEFPYAEVSLYMKLDTPVVREQVACQAFNAYFAELLEEEFGLRRSMAAVPTGAVEMPVYVGGATCFQGEIETWHEAVMETLDAYMSLLRDMPERPELFEGVRRTLRSTYLKSDPDMRRQSMSYEVYRRAYPDGFPLGEWLTELERLTYEDMMDYYESHIRNGHIAIAIMGDPVRIGMRGLRERYGKVKRIGKEQMFVDNMTVVIDLLSDLMRFGGAGSLRLPNNNQPRGALEYKGGLHP